MREAGWNANGFSVVLSVTSEMNPVIWAFVYYSVRKTPSQFQILRQKIRNVFEIMHPRHYLRKKKKIHAVTLPPFPHYNQSKFVKSRSCFPKTSFSSSSCSS